MNDVNKFLFEHILHVAHLFIIISLEDIYKYTKVKLRPIIKDLRIKKI